ncbi:hypothetical protein BO83DRAFT_184647 [Aspergillus eucalypticola CBS 122712]|uniref:Uncharacterized protein n=1 Tax=Aspergillus eucalypticola (strain CBS 122712 / IBT 29274) TaxID=1448314 RepID=A0A317UNN2_ASPEC|nr:uncharacterized protein BO83DRAFT_184647 [Aspergillus eucalypticola CBS 122712]PWY62758.1 hypothetical protein BO83DRAFT_184647 [Aspergillus eucalypticola CBS 122712]
MPFISLSLSVSFPPCFFFPNNSPPPKTCDINRRPDRFGIFRRTEDQRFMILIRASIYCYLFFFSFLPSFPFSFAGHGWRNGWCKQRCTWMMMICPYGIESKLDLEKQTKKRGKRCHGNSARKSRP